MFTVYTYFGRVVSTHQILPNETHHIALESARKSLLTFEQVTNNPAWIKHT